MGITFGLALLSSVLSAAHCVSRCDIGEKGLLVRPSLQCRSCEGLLGISAVPNTRLTMRSQPEHMGGRAPSACLSSHQHGEAWEPCYLLPGNMSLRCRPADSSVAVD
ncbi:hypothetical protein GE09DRAFT_1130758 [Coniochaeta sp. 2T2.1]|nr:hypothetical protein GE09DRAFT_1130758 [Coniochaeta sp. 2T2.1]